MKKIILLSLFFVVNLSIFAEHFSAVNRGRVLYYNILNEDEKTMEVTFRGASFDLVKDEYVEHVYVPETVIRMGKKYTVVRVSDNAFRGCSRLRSVSLPSSIKEIGVAVFEGCSSLAKVVLPDSIDIIRSRSFAGCISLESITIPSLVERIEDEAFADCELLETFHFPKQLTSYDEDVWIGTISLNSFTVDPENSQFSSIDGVLYDKTGKVILRVPEGKASVQIADSVRVVGEKSFSNCKVLKSVVLPESIVQIDSYAFENCIALSSLSFPKSITRLAEGVCKGCESMTEIVFSDKMIRVGQSAFENCKSLSKIDFAKVEELGKRSFFACDSLKEVTLPVTLKSIETETFGDCLSLLKITSLALDPAQCEVGAFDARSTYKCLLFVPGAAVQKYRSAQGWKGLYHVNKL